MPSRCWDTRDTLSLPVEILEKSKPCPSSLVLSQGLFAQGLRARCWGAQRVLGGSCQVIPTGYKEVRQVPRTPAGYQDVCWVLGMSARLWGVHRDWNARWVPGCPRGMPGGYQVGEAGDAHGSRRVLSVPVPGCGGALVPPRGLSPPGGSGVAGGAGGTGPWLPRGSSSARSPAAAAGLR